MKGNHNKEVIGLWFNKANDDELNIKSLLKHRDGTPGAVCFLSQQMAEKYLKGLLVYLKNEIIKTHDLIKISEIITDSLPDTKEIREAANSLNQFYIETRYIGDFPEFSWKDAEKAYNAAKEIKEFVLGKIK